MNKKSKHKIKYLTFSKFCTILKEAKSPSQGTATVPLDTNHELYQSCLSYGEKLYDPNLFIIKMR